jgi:hypothetical protein
LLQAKTPQKKSFFMLQIQEKESLQIVSEVIVQAVPIVAPLSQMEQFVQGCMLKVCPPSRETKLSQPFVLKVTPASHCFGGTKPQKKKCSISR